MAHPGVIFFVLGCMGITLTASAAFVSPENCGVSDVSGVLGDRIVGGREALRGEFPWQVSLRYQDLFISSTHMCGASILNQWWIITAAHCVYEMPKSNLAIVVGLHNQNDKFTIVNGSYRIDRLVVHEKYNPNTFYNDIALLKVTKPLPLGWNLVNSICLPQPGEEVEGFVTASGWGALHEDGSASSLLMTVDLPVVPQPICEIIIGRYQFSPSIMFCAGYQEGGKDTCQGDSGGPMVQRKNGGPSVLVGLVSAGAGCALPNSPGTYTLVPNFMGWIQKNTD